MAKKKELTVELVHQYGYGKKAKKPGSKISLPEEEAKALIAAGHAVEPKESVAVDSDTTMLHEQVADLEQKLSAAEKRAADAEADRDTKLTQAQGYAEELEKEIDALKAQFKETPTTEEKNDKAAK
ncbi:hypothetical protein [Halodesulfovibrio aestuarii]|uniref:Uncharacterized protein n=1 Tax=Halodesulfovibrio aestuarii TaxID=126333 RepID=A0ABV4JXH6_9BACT